ncbi:unnamed protein product [Gadus morhua 'NCC']
MDYICVRGCHGGKRRQPSSLEAAKCPPGARYTAREWWEKRRSDIPGRHRSNAVRCQQCSSALLGDGPSLREHGKRLSLDPEKRSGSKTPAWGAGAGRAPSPGEGGPS